MPNLGPRRDSPTTRKIMLIWINYHPTKKIPANGV